MTPKVHLSLDPTFNPTPDSTVASLVAHEANYSGYTAGGLAPTLSTVVNLAPNISGIIANCLFKSAVATPFVSAVVYGWWLDADGTLVAAETFGPGITFGFAVPGDFLNLEVRLPVNLLQRAA